MKALAKTTNCTRRAKKSGGARPKKSSGVLRRIGAPPLAPLPTFKFVPTPLVIDFVRLALTLMQLAHTLRTVVFFATLSRHVPSHLVG